MFKLFIKAALRQVTAIVARGHYLAVSASRAEGDEVTAPRPAELHILAEDIAALANRAYHIISLKRGIGRRREVLRGMNGTIERRAQEFGKPCIDYEKLLCMPFLNIKSTGYQTAALSYHGTPQFKMKFLPLA